MLRKIIDFVTGRRSTTHRRKAAIYRRKCCTETLEDRRLLAISWANEFNANNQFDDYFTSDEIIARQLVNRAIDDWEAVITDFNYDGDNNPNTNNTFQLTVIAAPISGRGGTNTTFSGQLPTSATVFLDDNGAGLDWFFDPTPFDDAEFTAIANSGTTETEPSFQGTFIDVNGGHADFYRTIVHEIGHAMGLASSSPAFALTGNPGEQRGQNDLIRKSF